MIKNKALWLSLVCVVALELFVVLNGCRQAFADTGGTLWTLDQFYFNAGPVVGLFIALTLGLFQGTEYSDGTLRNKLMVGHTRQRVYLVKLLMGVLVACLFTAAVFLAGLVGFPALGLWKMGMAGVARNFLISLGFHIALTALFTMVGMLSEKKSTTAVAVLLLFLAMSALSLWLYGRLEEPEMSSGIILTAQGMQWAEPTPNPNYVGGFTRTVYRFLVECLPTGQAFLMASSDLGSPIVHLTASVVLTAVSTLVGMTCFQKKDLK
ncbi:MAG: ABC transporter permease [Oscillospiraceae bacterium]|nr:ABC transporter permease [Oscillospiraceae bacterium]